MRLRGVIEKRCKLAVANNGESVFVQQRQKVFAGRRDGVVVPVFTAIERSRRAEKWPGNNPADFMFAPQNAAGYLADFIQPVERNYLFMRSDLKDRIG